MISSLSTYRNRHTITNACSAAWNNNTVGARGDLAVNEGLGWIVIPDSELTAFAVLGE